MTTPDWSAPEWLTPADTYDEATVLRDWNKLRRATASTVISCHKREGMDVLAHFQPHFWATEGPTGESIAKHWTNPDLRQKALERTQKHYKTIYKSEIRRNLAFFSKAPLPTMYRPLLTKGIVERFGAKAVLDPCIGWGGRMIGTLAVDDTTFTGCEPSTRTYSGLRQMAEFCGVSDRATLHCAGAETVLPTLTSEAYDLVLTSPPYFTLEVYAHEDTQSVTVHTTWSEWVEKWLDPVIANCLRCLKKDGISAWSVKDMKKMPLAKEVKRIHEKYGFVLFETVGMCSTVRNQGGGTKLTEETFLFRRTDVS